MKANLFVIGASKCGTSFLHDVLNAHPQISMSIVKEPRFFTKPEKDRNIDEYRSLFMEKEGVKYFGESSPSYSEVLYFENVAQEICNYSSESKIIYIVRSPYKRLLSVFNQALSTGHHLSDRYGRPMDQDFRKALVNYPPMLDATKYHTVLTEYLKYFDRESIKAVFFERLVNNPIGQVREIEDFLGVKYFNGYEFEKFNQNPGSLKAAYTPLFSSFSKIIPQRLKEQINPIMLLRLKRLFYIFSTGKVKLKESVSEIEKEVIHRELSDEISSLYKCLNEKEDPMQFYS